MPAMVAMPTVVVVPAMMAMPVVPMMPAGFLDLWPNRRGGSGDTGRSTDRGGRGLRKCYSASEYACDGACHC